MSDLLNEMSEIDTRLIEVIVDHLKIMRADLSPLSGPIKGDIEAWDSFGHVILMLAIEDAFGIKFRADEISQLNTVKLIDRRLKTKD